MFKSKFFEFETNSKQYIFRLSEVRDVLLDTNTVEVLGL